MGLNLVTTAILAGCAVVALTVELIGVANHRKGDTITENWRAADRWLSAWWPAAGWLWRFGTIGLLMWTILHFATGAR